MNSLEKEIYKEALQEKLHIYSAAIFQSGTAFSNKHKSTQCSSIIQYFITTEQEKHCR